MFGSELITNSVENPKQSGPAIVPFITAGYPDKYSFLELCLDEKKGAYLSAFLKRVKSLTN